MTALYVETSALLSWLFGESRSEEVKRAIDSASVVLSSALTLLEAERALTRFGLQEEVKEGDVRRARASMHNLLAEWTKMEISAQVRLRAGQRFPVEPVRALDAIHLASALEFVAAYPALTVLFFDKRVTDNLEPLGLEACDASSPA